MTLRFLGIDPDTNGINCPAVFTDDATGDLIFQGWTVSDPETGEQVRWLPRHQVPGLLVPLCDFWVLDDRLVRFGYFAGDGEFLDDAVTDDPEIARTCADAFERVWERAIPHADYRPV